MENRKSIRAFVIITPQNDFFEGGSVAVPKSNKIIEIINRVKLKLFDFIIITKLWRPINHWYIFFIFLVLFLPTIQ